MTTIYDTYYPSIQSGEIDLNNVDFSVITVGEEYEPKEDDAIDNVIDIIKKSIHLIVGDDIAKLTMSEIIDKIKNNLSEEELQKSKGIVVYDTLTDKLCFYENIM